MKPDCIVLHHSATPDGATLSWGAIRRYHTAYKCEGKIIRPDMAEAMAAQGMPVQKPWRDIGYHFGIELASDHYEIIMGRMADETGAHCKEASMNRRSLGICFVGNFDLTEVPDGQWELGLRLVRVQMKIYKIPAAMVHGHREFATYKSCPGHLFDLDRFRRELEA